VSYDMFISKAPRDHRKIPESYYSLAVLKMTTGQMDKESYMDYYKKGLESEKYQLPCFLPYKSRMKATFEARLDLVSGIEDSKKDFDTNDKRSNESNTLIESTGMTRDNIKKDFRRINLQIEFRQYCFYMKKNLDESPRSNFYTTFEPPRKQTTQEKSSDILKNIFFKDMDFTKDQVLHGYILTVRNIDITVVGLSSTFLIVEDENGFAERLFIYNLKDSKKDIEKTYQIGSCFSIINPYVRMAADMKPAIRVDDPKSIVFIQKEIQDVCRFCLKEDHNMKKCSRCGKAKYCSKECQIDDWKILQHKLICN
jgi:hypothetical protein